MPADERKAVSLVLRRVARATKTWQR